MRNFLYFAAGITTPITLEMVERLGLRYAFDEVPMHGVIEGRTPSGKAGTIMATRGDGEMSFKGEPSQVWRKRPGDDCVWVGMSAGQPPTPADLLRPLGDRQYGEEIDLADGHKWQIPRLVWHAGEDGFQLALPTYYDLDDAGRWVCSEVEEKFKHLLPLADRIYEGVYKSEVGGKRLSTEELLGLAPTLLAANYRVSPIEIAMLRLFKKGSYLRRMAEVAVDFDTAMNELKKNNLAAAG